MCFLTPLPPSICSCPRIPAPVPLPSSPPSFPSFLPGSLRHLSALFFFPPPRPQSDAQLAVRRRQRPGGRTGRAASPADRPGPALPARPGQRREPAVRQQPGAAEKERQHDGVRPGAQLRACGGDRGQTGCVSPRVFHNPDARCCLAAPAACRGTQGRGAEPPNTSGSAWKIQSWTLLWSRGVREKRRKKRAMFGGSCRCARIAWMRFNSCVFGPEPDDGNAVNQGM
ncbi:unnamed protein product [Tetraodon nigroviridis]|uniref:(spotted green pufferfish) hypothetical protein n=1 Tax=Tetraodon nigroviridis TaxID=99883 RepID=Q4T8P2_TETNG|nr:unnamed protein product [Tetraodon nigroviridis]